jgi:hypothetical protein
MDDDGSGALSFSEFKKGIRECSLDIQEDVSVPMTDLTLWD